MDTDVRDSEVAFFKATVNQMLDGSSQLPTTAERAIIKSFSTVQTTKQ